MWVFLGCACWGQGIPAASTPVTAPATVGSGAAPAQAQAGGATGSDAGPTASVWAWKGLRVTAIEFQGVTFDKGAMLPQELAQKVDTPLDPEQVRSSLRRLFASGRYRDIAVRGVRRGDDVTLIFAGTARYYVGRVTIEGLKNDRVSSLLEFATKLQPGTAFNEPDVATGLDGG